LLAPPFRARVLLPASPATVAPEPWFTREQYHGRIVLLNFWASWCSTCRTEAGLLNRLHTEYGSETFAVVGLATADDPEHAVTVGRALQHRYLIALDSDGSIAQSFDVNSLPQTFLIDASGRICYHLQGPIQDSHWPGLTRAIRHAQARLPQQRAEP
jgi:cytochrome c biogenesis protein CcmG/thiol:disulfide interchange protein DsbE